jgi:hypothetical protein
MDENNLDPVEPDKLTGVGKFPDDLYALDANEFLANVPTLVTRLRMRVPNEAWSLNLSPGSLALLSRLLNEGFVPQAGDHIVAGINKSVVEEVTAYLGSVVVRSLNGKWRKPADAKSEPYVLYRHEGRRKSAYPFGDALEMAVEGEYDLERWYRLLLD